MTRKRSRPTDGVSRRKFIAATGGASVVALAGCSGNGGNGNGNGNDHGNGNGNGGAEDPTDAPTSGSDSLSGTIEITGSSTVFPVSDAMAEHFMEMHPDVNVTVDSTGSGGGFENHFCPGNSDINGASRPIKDSEVEHCSDNGVNPVELHIAGDALTMAVNNDADWVDCMTFDELSQIWRDGGAEMWSDIRDDWPDEPFELFGPASTSGTYDWFNANVIGEDHDHTAEHEPTEEDNLIVQGIQDSEYAMGYFGYAYYNSNSDAVTAVEVRETEDDPCGAPSLEAASEGTYPMARPLFIYPSEEAINRDVVYEFLQFYLEEAGTELVSDIGYVPSNDDMVQENLDAVESVRS
jgi:phosphate transport system substrate-binding protein